MKLSTKATIFGLIGSAMMMVGVFAKPLGIPTDFDCVPTLLAIVFFYLAYRTSKKGRATGQIPAASDTQKRKQLILIVASCAVGCSVMPFLLPVTGLSLPFGEVVVISIISFFVCVGAAWLGMKMQK